MTTSRAEVVAFAAALDGLGADPSDDEARAVYIDLVAPGETEARAGEMAGVWGCALVARGVLRAFIEHARLAPPYRDGKAMTDLVEIARQAGGAYGPQRVPEPGDLVVVGGGAGGGGPEHVYVVLEIAEGLVTGLDGGQKDDGGHQVIRVREHVLTDGWDTAHDDQSGGSVRRKIRWVLDVDAVIERFGR